MAPRRGTLEHRREASFLAQTQTWYADGEGRDLEALIICSPAQSGPSRVVNVRIEESASGSTRLYHAAQRGWRSATRWLIQHGADVNAIHPSSGFTPILNASFFNKNDAIRILLDAGARVDARTGDGQSSLTIAAQMGYLELCKLLLSRGASLELRNGYGEDAETYARRCSRERLGFRHQYCATTADFLADVRVAGGWADYADAPRKELLALRRQLPSLRERGRAAPSSSVPVHERLFVEVPDDVFVHAVAFWRGPRDL